MTFDRNPTDEVVVNSRKKRRDPDPALDDLLARIETSRHTATGAEMYARAAARGSAGHNQMVNAWPVFATATGHGAYSNLGRTGGRT